MTPIAFDALRRAVNIAREGQVQSVRRLRTLLKEQGYADEAINEALQAWAEYLKTKP
jgi:hypothetical protein